ncbi:papain-like cysteine protease family protein [Hymenobacter algoricola]|uniref:papain-like cysteine protease family protein n=1 Tax=Hymenobacter algoricola TaxID=486267 RepID=UPI0031EBDE63
MKYRHVLLGIVFCLSSIGATKAQDPILNIENRVQIDPMWCWAAASEQIIYWLTGNDISQCQLVATAKHANPMICCTTVGACSVPGSLTDIQNLVLAYGGHYSSIAPPASPSVLYNTLLNNKAVVIYLQTSPTIGHFVVLRGMAWQNTPDGMMPIFYLNDPMSIYVRPVDFNQLYSIWRAAIVVY